jgi:sterol desaturase/sphingolipid hydroxylase (fatty acid hydroxylase superfamily)
LFRNRGQITKNRGDPDRLILFADLIKHREETAMDFIITYFSNLSDNLLPGIRIEGLRYLIGTVGVFLLTWVMFRPLLTRRLIRKRPPSKLLNRQIMRELKNSFLSILVFIAAYTLVNLLLETVFGFRPFKTYADMNAYPLWMIPLSIILFTVGLDTWFYWTHRMMHHPKFYKFFHMEHHRSHSPTPFTAYSFAPPEAVLVYLFVPIFQLIMPMHTSAFIAAMLIQTSRNALAHCGYEIFPRGWTKVPVLNIFTTVTHHDLHHERSHGNYGFYFTFWDKVMGTEDPDYHKRFDAVTERTASTPAPVLPALEG